MVALAHLWGLTQAMELWQILFPSLETKASSDAITDVCTRLPICRFLSPFPGSSELEMTVWNLFLPFCWIHHWRMGRLPRDLVWHLSLVLSMGTHSCHSHQHPDISGSLSAFHHPSLLFGFSFAALLFLPDVTYIPQKVKLLCWSFPWTLNQQLLPEVLFRVSPCWQRKLLV